MKEKLFKKGITRRLFSVVLALAMVFSLMPMTSLTAYAATTKTVTFTDADITKWGLTSIEKDGVTITAESFIPTGGIGGHDGIVFSTSSGNFTKIVITANVNFYISEGWTNSNGNKTTTWEGKSPSVTQNSGDDLKDFTITCTIEESHSHDWEYSLDGTSTIKAVCIGAEDCTVENGKTTGVSLTLTASSANYSGSAYSGASLGDTSAWASAVGNDKIPVITYEAKEGSELTDGKAVNVGSYTAKATVGDVTATTEFSITPAALTITGAAVADKTYDGTTTANVTGVTFQGGTLTKDTDYTVTGAFNSANVADADTVTVTVTLTNSNYSLETNTYDVNKTIAKADPAYTAPTGLTAYVGKTLADVTLPEGFTWVEDAETSVGEEGSNTFHVKFTPEDTDNYNVVESVEVTVTVSAKQTQTLTFAAESVTKTYGDDGFTAAATGAETTVTYSSNNAAVATVDAATGEVTIVGAGQVTITASAAEDETHAAASASYTLTVNKADPDVTAPTAKELTYTGNAQELVNAGSAVGGTMVYSLTENGEYTETIPTGTDVDEYAVWYMVEGDANHNDTEPASVTVTIDYGCRYEETAKLDEGTFKLYLNAKYAGTYAIEAVSGGYAVRDEQGYLTVENGKLVHTETPAAWSYKNGGLTQSVTTVQKILGIFKTTRTTTYYLASASSVSTSTVKMELRKDTVSVVHTYGKWIDNKNGTHTRQCSHCVGYEVENCVYDEVTHKCVCGAFDPAAKSVKVSVTEKVTRTGLIFKRTTYTYTITAVAEGVKVSKVQYNNGSSWVTGSTYQTSTKKDTLNIRVTDNTGTVWSFTYQNGEVVAQ